MASYDHNQDHGQAVTPSTPTYDDEYVRDNGHDPVIIATMDPKFSFTLDHGCDTRHSLAITHDHDRDHGHGQAMSILMSNFPLDESIMAVTMVMTKL